VAAIGRQQVSRFEESSRLNEREIFTTRARHSSQGYASHVFVDRTTK